MAPQSLQTPRSPYQIMAGTVITAALVTGLKSDLPGPVIGQVSENVYDSVTGQTLLIPQGSRVIGPENGKGSTAPSPMARSGCC